MKYFICNLDRINYGSGNGNSACLGIPAGHTERIIALKRIQNILYESGSEGEAEVFISLPVLLELKDTAAPHGVVLKTKGAPGADTRGKTVLLAPKIENEIEIPEEEIKQLPGALAEILTFFRGAYFSGQDLIYILDPIKLVEDVIRSQK